MSKSNAQRPAQSRILKLCSALIVAFFFSTGFLGFGNSEVNMVKDAPFHLNNSYTYGKLLETYKYIKDGDWKLIEGDRGQKIVVFTAKYDIKTAVEYECKRHKVNLDNETLTEVVKLLEKRGFQPELTAQFVIASNGQSFKLGYTGLETPGKEYNRPSIYNSIMKNEPCLVFYTKKDEELMHYAVWKALIKKAFDNSNDIGGATHAQYPSILYRDARSHDESKMPVVITRITDVSFNDTSLDIIADAEYQVLTLSKSELNRASGARELQSLDIYDSYAVFKKSNDKLKYKVLATFRKKFKKWEAGRSLSLGGIDLVEFDGDRNKPHIQLDCNEEFTNNIRLFAQILPQAPHAVNAFIVKMLLKDMRPNIVKDLVKDLPDREELLKMIESSQPQESVPQAQQVVQGGMKTFVGIPAVYTQNMGEDISISLLDEKTQKPIVKPFPEVANTEFLDCMVENNQMGNLVKVTGEFTQGQDGLFIAKDPEKLQCTKN